MSTVKFNYNAEELSAFGITCGIFVISLKDGQIVQHNPSEEHEAKEFYSWLKANNVREVAAEPA